MFFLHKENTIGVKQLSDADLGISDSSHQTHIGLSEKVFSFLSGDPECRLGVFVFNGSCSAVDCLFSKIAGGRSTKIDYGENKQLKSVTQQIRHITGADTSANWFIVWFALYDETPVFWLLKQNSEEYQRVNRVVSLENRASTSFSTKKTEFFSLLKEIGKLDKLSNYIEDKVKKEAKGFLIATSDEKRTFARLVFHYFYSVDKLESVAKHFNRNDLNVPISVSEKGAFGLQNLFVFATPEEIAERNRDDRRWYNDPFEVNGKSLYLYVDWYEEKSGNTPRLYLSDLIAMVQLCYDKRYVYRKNQNVYELWYDMTNSARLYDLPESVVSENKFEMNSVIDSVKSSGLIYDDLLIKRFATSLLTKPFVILSGLAGSGKTQLALAFAKALVADDSQMCVVSVGADWTNREPLLGYPNALKDGEYVHPESGVLDLLIEADKPGNKDKPYFLILDEMNLSYVERYFADFLSAMESHEPIRLWDGDNEKTPKRVLLPKNLFIVGTINVDETTYMFSPKVLDRANVIEFKVSEVEMTSFLDKAPAVNLKKIEKITDQAADFVSIAQGDVVTSNAANDILKKFFKELKKANAEFGYRTAAEIGRFIGLASSMTPDEAVDSVIVQKLLPKLHGSRKKIVPVLKALWGICVSGVELENSSISDADKSNYPLAADKMYRMYQSAIDNGFTSFAEA